VINKTLFNISPSDISPNPHNPRLIFDEEGMSELKKSIAKVGILVPLTVYLNQKEVPKTKYILLDGERRWRVAKELNMETVPANVIEEPRDVTQNILFMFNIHHYRKEWELFPTALKLEVVIKALETDNELILSQFTGVNRSMIRRCKILLWFPIKYRDILMDRRGRVSTDFFIELYPIAYRLSQEPEFSYGEGLEKLVDGLISIFNDGKVIVDVKEFREIRKSMGYYDSAGKFNVFKEKMSQFLDRPESTLDIFASPELEVDQVRRNILRYVSYLNANLKDVDPDIISDLVIVEQLETLRNYLEDILIKIS
jgi:ParB/RepB/Spo0J family partition protein